MTRNGSSEEHAKKTMTRRIRLEGECFFGFVDKRTKGVKAYCVSVTTLGPSPTKILAFPAEVSEFRETQTDKSISI
ncbi:hypothetical protein V6N13_062164 [Hibiscus sabdariffa]